MSHARWSRRRRTSVLLARSSVVVAAGVAVVTALSSVATATPSAVAATSPRTTAVDLLGAPIGFSDVDTRVGSVLPTASQLSAVTALGATVRWNRFGTPQTLINHGGYLATGLAADPATAARAWLSSHADLFRLDPAAVAALPVRVNPMAEKKAYAVSFTQTWNGLPSVLDGVITLGVSDGKISIVTSSSVGKQAAPAASTLTGAQAWVAAATNVGRPTLLTRLGAPKLLANGWSSFSAGGFGSLQYTRPVAIASPTGGVRSGFEALVVDAAAASPTAYSVVVDGITGAVVMRQNRVDQSEERQVVSASYSATDCGAPVPAGSVTGATKTIVLVMNATVPTNDIVVKLLKGTTVVATEDTGVGNEALTYAPAGGVPAGDYFAQVCPFVGSDTPFVAPFTATGVFLATDSSTPSSVVPYPPTWSYFTNSPPLTYASRDNRITGCWTKVAGDTTCKRKEQNLASRLPWDVLPQTGLPTFTTSGNNAVTAQAWLNPLAPGPAGPPPVAADRKYTFSYANGWNTSKCNPTGIVAGPLNGTDVDAATTNLFVGHNRFHDFSYYLGFTEDNYNAQVSSFGNTSAGPSASMPDPEVGNVQAGALDGGFPSFMGRDNANQIALPDGVPGITNQYLFQPIAGAFYSPCADGDLDTSIFGHEYTHLISNRMVGGPDSNLTGLQAGSMGESWSDQDALEYMMEFGYTPQAGENPFSVGAYATGNKKVGIRDYSLDANPLNYSDIGFDTTGPEVHADGEIWNGVAYDVRQALVAKYDAAFPSTDKKLQLRCAQGELPSDFCPGNRRWIQIVFDAFLLQPAATSMLDARDAYLAADMMRYGGANQAALWGAFAKRGMGVGASTVDTDDPDPVADFVAGTGSKASTVTFDASVVDQGPTRVKAAGAKIFIGEYEAGVTPVATTDANGAATVRMEPGTYRMTVQRAGLGLTKLTLVVPANQSVTRQIHLVTNLLSASNGSTVTQSANSTNAASLIDDTESTNWADEGTLPVDTTTPTVTVHVGGTETSPKTIRSLRVSAYLAPGGGQSRFEALRKFRVDTCVVSAVDPTCSLPTSFHTVYTSADNAFPATVPRPVAPDLNSRIFDVPDFAASYVRLVALQSQCTGNPQYRGEQDNDPLNATDCVTGSAANPLTGATGNAVRAAEFEAFGFDAAVKPPNDPVAVVTVAAPATTTVGSTLTYSIGYTNLGPAASDHALLTDRLPAGLSFVSAPGATYTGANRTVTWSLGSVPAGASATKTLTVKVTALPGTGILDQATFAGDLTTGVPGAAYTVVTG